MAQKGLAGQPNHDIGIFAERPKQRDLAELGKGFAQNVDALRLQLVETVHGPLYPTAPAHDTILLGVAAGLSTTRWRA